MHQLLRHAPAACSPAISELALLNVSQASQVLVKDGSKCWPPFDICIHIHVYIYISTIEIHICAVGPFLPCQAVFSGVLDT